MGNIKSSSLFPPGTKIKPSLNYISWVNTSVVSDHNRDLLQILLCRCFSHISFGFIGFKVGRIEIFDQLISQPASPFSNVLYNSITQAGAEVLCNQRMVRWGCLTQIQICTKTSKNKLWPGPVTSDLWGPGPVTCEWSCVYVVNCYCYCTVPPGCLKPGRRGVAP